MTHPRRISPVWALGIALLLAAGGAQAACYADYKAKKDGPLRLHYGVVEIPDGACSRRDAARVIARKIGRDGWELLDVLGVFGADGLAERRGNAGRFYLRY